MPERRFAKHFRRWLPIVVLIPLAYALRVPVWTPIDNRFYNYFHSKRTVEPWQHVAMVGIDDRAVETALGRPVYPLSRHSARHAAVVKQLAACGARAVLLDLRLTEEDFSAAPTVLANAIQDAGNVYLAMSVVEKFDDQGLADIVLSGEMPHPSLVEAARGVLVVQVGVDPDGVLRRFAPDPRLKPLGLETFAERLSDTPVERNTPIVFPSLDAPLPYISYADVVDSTWDGCSLLAGRIVFVGSVLDESTDYITVPRAQRMNGGRPVFRLPGAGALAAITETLIVGSPVRDVDWPLVLLWNVLWSVLAVAVMPFKRPVLSAFVLLGVLVTALAAAGAIHVAAGWVLPAGLLFGCIAMCGVYTLVSSYVETTRDFYIEEAENRRVQSEMRMARETQEAFLPDRIPVVPGYDLAGVNISSLEVSGDYYDFVRRGDNVVIAIGDVKGKGMPASLLMSNVQAGLHTQLYDPGVDLEQVVGNLNRLVCENTGVEDFVTFALAEIDASKAQVSIVRAGHELPVVVRGDGTVEFIEEGGPVLGLVPGLPFEPAQVGLSVGDVVCFYTDGVTEAFAPDGEEFGLDRLVNAVTAERFRTAQEIIERVVASVRAFAGSHSLPDDVTLVVIRVTPPAGAPS